MVAKRNIEHTQHVFKIIFPFLGLLFMLIDGQITLVLTSMSTQRNVFSSQLLLLLFITAYFYLGKSAYLIVWTTLFGIIYDLYYYGIIGIFTLCFPLMILILDAILKLVKPHLYSYLMVFLLCNIWVMYGSYFMELIFNLTDYDFLSYMILYVAPSLLLNAIFDTVALIYGRKFYLSGGYIGPIKTAE